MSKKFIVALGVSTVLLLGCSRLKTLAGPQSVAMRLDQEKALHLCDELRGDLVTDVNEAMKAKPDFDGFQLAERDSKMMKILNCRNFDPT